MLSIKLALRNLLGAGMRTWLNVAVLAFCYILIIFYNGMIDGWNEQASNDTINWEIGGGLLTHPDYDRFDPLTLADAHQEIPKTDVSLCPILISQASIYPQGRLLPVMLKGINPDQNHILLPTEKLKSNSSAYPVILGKRMAKAAKLAEGDEVTLRIRDDKGAFDAVQIQVAHIFDSNVPTVDDGQIWMALPQVQKLLTMPGEATLLITEKNNDLETGLEGWKLLDQDELLEDLRNIIDSKKGSGTILYGLLLIIALLAVFDTQILSIFRRQKEIGTYIALGMTRGSVVRLFTIEGTMYSILAALAAFVFGSPILYFLVRTGIPIPAASQNSGISVADRITPTYGLSLIVTTIFIVVVSATIVSYLPSRKISKMKPTEALKGKLQ